MTSDDEGTIRKSMMMMDDDDDDDCAGHDSNSEHGACIRNLFVRFDDDDDDEYVDDSLPLDNNDPNHFVQPTKKTEHHAAPDLGYGLFQLEQQNHDQDAMHSKIMSNNDQQQQQVQHQPRSQEQKFVTRNILGLQLHEQIIGGSIANRLWPAAEYLATYLWQQMGGDIATAVVAGSDGDGDGDGDASSQTAPQNTTTTTATKHDDDNNDCVEHNNGMNQTINCSNKDGLLTAFNSVATMQSSCTKRRPGRFINDNGNNHIQQQQERIQCQQLLRSILTVSSRSNRRRADDHVRNEDDGCTLQLASASASSPQLPAMSQQPQFVSSESSSCCSPDLWILELGAGLGLTGLAVAARWSQTQQQKQDLANQATTVDGCPDRIPDASSTTAAIRNYCAAHLVLTDLPEAMPLLRRNVEQNVHRIPHHYVHMTVQTLAWGNVEHVDAILAAYQDSCRRSSNSNNCILPSLLILGSDCVYWEELHAPLEWTVARLLSGASTISAAAAAAAASNTKDDKEDHHHQHHYRSSPPPPPVALCLLASVRRWKRDQAFFYTLGKRTRTSTHELRCICIHERIVRDYPDVVDNDNEANQPLIDNYCKRNESETTPRREIMRIYAIQWTERNKGQPKK